MICKWHVEMVFLSCVSSLKYAQWYAKVMEALPQQFWDGQEQPVIQAGMVFSCEYCDSHHVFKCNGGWNMIILHFQKVIENKTGDDCSDKLTDEIRSRGSDFSNSKGPKMKLYSSTVFPMILRTCLFNLSCSFKLFSNLFPTIFVPIILQFVSLKLDKETTKPQEARPKRRAQKKPPRAAGGPLFGESWGVGWVQPNMLG